MASVIVYYAHPGDKHSQVNRQMAAKARALTEVTFVDLYREYPRFIIDIDREQQRLLDHDVIVFQYPMFWYSSPSLMKEWLDLVLEHGFAYGDGGDRLRGKSLMLAITAAGSHEAYQTDGYQNHPITDFLAPMQQTAKLCGMNYLPPYVLYSSLKAPANGERDRHVAGYEQLLHALCDQRYKPSAAASVIEHHHLPSIISPE